MKIGFIGGAINSAVGTTHKISAQMDGRFQLAAGCFSTSAEINSETSRLWGIPPANVYASWEQMLDDAKEVLDAVVVLTPTPMHAEMVISALDHGYAVICEKAMCVSSLEADSVCRAVSRNSGFLAVTYNYSGYPMLRELRALIADGRLGVLNQIHVEMPQEGFLRILKEEQKPVPQQWRLIDADVPTLALDLGVHLHHIIDFLSGQKPIEVCAIDNTFGHFPGVTDNTMCLARYTGNLDCQIWYGKTALGATNGLRVRAYGTRGAAEWYQMEPEWLDYYDSRGHHTRIERASVDVSIADEPRYNRFKAGHPAGFLEAFANYYVDISDCLQDFRNTGKQQSQWVAGAELSREGLIMLEAMARSAKEKSWQAVALDAQPTES